MTAQILPAESCGLTQVKNSSGVSQHNPDIIRAVNVKRRGSATCENYAGQYVLRPNLPRHCLALVGNATETTANYGIFTSSGLCCLSQSLSAAFMRVCQPLPVALNASTTSGEYRIFTATFGQSVTGRPLRRIIFNLLSGISFIFSSSSNIESGSEATALRIFASSSSLGKIVPGLSFGISSNLLFGCGAKADNSVFSKIIGFGKTDRKHSITEVSNTVGNACISDFAIVDTVIFNDNHTPPIKQFCIGKRVAVFAFVGCVLVWIKGDFHVFIVATKNIFANCLYWLGVMSYAYPAPHKTGAGRCNPNMYRATPDARGVFFVVCYMCDSMAWYAKQQGSYNRRSPALLSYHAANNGAVYCLSFGVSLPFLVRVTVISRVNSTSRRQRMVTLAGQPQGWPVPLYAGIATPVNVTAPVECGNSSGDSVNVRGGRLMATTPAQNMLFVWRFWSVLNSTYLTTTAASEREARSQLPAVIARIRMEVQHYA